MQNRKSTYTLPIIFLNFITLLVTPGLCFADPYNGALTDEEIFLRDNYYHEGYSIRTKEELCGKASDGSVFDNSKMENCLGKGDFSKGTIKIFGDSMTDALAKMLSIFFGVSGLSHMEKGKLPAGAKPDAKPESVKKDSFDVCGIIPTATEMVAQTMQGVSQDHLKAMPGIPGEKQLEALSKAVKAHETREKTAWIQAGGWGAATLCYTFNMKNLPGNIAGGNISGAASFAIKFVISSLLLTHYTLRALAAKKAKEATEDILEKFKKKTGKGKCNPITENPCYCAEPQTRYDAKYCLPKPFQSRFAQKPETLISCVDSELKKDKNCQCLATNSCYDKTFDKFASEYGMGNVQMMGALQPVRSMLKGTFDQGKINTFTQGQLNAAKSYLKSLPPWDNGNYNLSDKQKNEVKALKALGLTEDKAAFFALKPMDSKALNYRGQLQDSLGGEIPNIGDLESLVNNNRYAAGHESSSSDHILYFNDAAGGKRDSDQNSNNSFDLLDKFKKKANGQNGQGEKTVNFGGSGAERAAMEAQIYKDPSKSLFDIVTNRYRLSAWERFQVVP